MDGDDMDQELIKIIDERIHELIGDISVPHQLNTAITNHTHKEYVTHDEYDALIRSVEILNALVGDTSVASQINAALQIKGGE